MIQINKKEKADLCNNLRIIRTSIIELCIALPDSDFSKPDQVKNYISDLDKVIFILMDDHTNEEIFEHIKEFVYGVYEHIQTGIKNINDTYFESTKTSLLKDIKAIFSRCEETATARQKMSFERGFNSLERFISERQDGGIRSTVTRLFFTFDKKEKADSYFTQEIEHYCRILSSMYYSTTAIIAIDSFRKKYSLTRPDYQQEQKSTETQSSIPKSKFLPPPQSVKLPEISTIDRRDNRIPSLTESTEQKLHNTEQKLRNTEQQLLEIQEKNKYLEQQVKKLDGLVDELRAKSNELTGGLEESIAAATRRAMVAEARVAEVEEERAISQKRADRRAFALEIGLCAVVAAIAFGYIKRRFM